MPLPEIDRLKSSFHGELFGASDSGYSDARRIWNASVDKHPALIARCSGVADVIAAVQCARESNLLTAIRGGGHNVGGRALCDDGLVIRPVAHARRPRRLHQSDGSRPGRGNVG